MYSIEKLKPNEKAFFLIIILLVAIVAIVVAKKNFGWEAAVGIWGLLVFVNAPFSFGEYLKTKNTGFLFAFLFQITASLFALLVVMHGLNIDRLVMFIFIVSMLIFGLTGIFYNFTKRTKWRYREVLELAAQTVDETTDGYTARPRAVGKIAGSENEIRNFGNFLLKNLIALPYAESDRIVFSLAMTLRHRMGLRSDYAECTHVVFMYNGSVSAYISKGDYLKYKDQFAFDQLCENMGNLFIEFFDLYKNGDSIRIVDRLNSLRLNPFSDFGESSV